MIKRLAATAAITFGVIFTGLVLMSIWGEIQPWSNEVIGKLLPTTGVLSVAFIALLGIIRMAEKNNNVAEKK